MILNSWAELPDLADYLGVAVGTLTSTDQRYLYRASELITAYTGARYSYANRLTDDDPYPALIRATCAQVEYWRANGEGLETDIPVTGYSIGKYSVQYASSAGTSSRAQRIAPRAYDALMEGGALSAGVDAW